MASELLLQIVNLKKTYGEKIILDNANLNIHAKQKIGVIGRNGAGKSTLFKIIMGEEEKDSGIVNFMPALKIGYIPQADPFSVDETVIGFLERYTKRPNWECATMAAKFQLKGEKLAGLIGDLSGGYQMRVKLTATLLFEPNLLLLDEPTNYLDLSTLLLLENFLQTFRGGFMVITHDREFIKKTCTSTVEVDQGEIYFHSEGLEDYLEFKEERMNFAAIANKNIEQKQKQLKTFVDRFGSKASMAKSAQSKLKVIDKLEDTKVSLKKSLATVRMLIPPVLQRSGQALELENVSIGYGDKIVASGITIDCQKGKKVAILGDNGQGKSTLMKTVVGSIPVLSGKMEWKSSLKVAYYAQHLNQVLDPNETIEDYLRRTSDPSVSDEVIFKMLGNFLFKKKDSQKNTGVLSGGEKARLCLAGMFLSLSDVILLDEPTNHLDFETVEAMGFALSQFNGTVFVISHDRTFVNLLADEIWEVGNGSVKRVLGSYSDYVWQKTMETTKQLNENSGESGDPFAPQNVNSSNKPVINLDKNQRVKLYNLKKEFGKCENKLKSLNQKKELDLTDQKNLEELEIWEKKWLELESEISKLES